MSRRSSAISAALVAAALTLAAGPRPAPAAGIIPRTDGMASFQLTDTSPAGTAPVTEVLAAVDPPGTVIPAAGNTSPLTILPGSSGFDLSNLNVLLGDGKTASGGKVQLLRLDFGGQGLRPGGMLNFSLNLDKAFQGHPKLDLPPSTTGLTLVPVDPSSLQASGQGPSAGSPGSGPVSSTGAASSGSGGSGSGIDSHVVPEPLTWVLWATGIVGLGLARARAYRQSHRAPA